MVGREFSVWRVLGGNFSLRKQLAKLLALWVFIFASFSLSFFDAYSSIPSTLVLYGSATACGVNE